MAELIQSTAIDFSPHTAAMPAFSRRQLNMLLLGLGFATGMKFYTADSIKLVLTDITGSFGVSGDEASWSLTVYSSALFLGVPVCVWLAGYIGHKSYLIASVVLFAASSVVSATTYSFETMLVAPAFQGWQERASWSGGGTVYMLLPKTMRSEPLMRVSTMLYLSTAFAMLFPDTLPTTLAGGSFAFRTLLTQLSPFGCCCAIFLTCPYNPRSGLPTGWASS